MNKELTIFNEKNNEKENDNMNNLKIFENEEFGAVRTMVIEDEVYFVGKDVAEALGYSNATKAVINHVDAEDKQAIMIEIAQSQNGILPQKSQGQTKTTIINESGLYALILSSKLPNAKKFKKWVTSEVLPSIRKNGGYINNQENMTPEQIVANALVVANNIIEDQKRQLEKVQKELEDQKPIVETALHLTESKAISVGDFSKILQKNGIKKMGRNNLFFWLKTNGYLMHDNKPYERYMKYFEVIAVPFITKYGTQVMNFQTLITGKGQLYFTKKIKDELLG